MIVKKRNHIFTHTSLYRHAAQNLESCTKYTLYQEACIKQNVVLPTREKTKKNMQ